jgi:cholesterol transport system auxiliary component
MPRCREKSNWKRAGTSEIREKGKKLITTKEKAMGLRKTTVLLAAGIVFVLASCSGLSRPSPKVEHYSLEYTLPAWEKLSPLPVVLKVNRFSAAPLYDTRQIIYREKPFSRDAYVYHRWRSAPADLATYFLSRDLKYSGLFASVLPHDSGLEGMFEMEGFVDEFMESDLQDAWEAVLTFSVTLIEANQPDVSKKILLEKTYHAKESCRLKNPRALAEAMSRAMAELSTRVITDVYDALKGRNPSL